ncbi:MAG TPA: prolyl oligopeptidase family serine peptidase [Reyranellaceae bacterium]|nr:prolyl oligopeptidase family serine peptidase [Reyranellaceae bacterium]
MVPVTVDGETVRLALITYKPPGTGPFPTVIFHHGSTGRGNDPSLFARPYDPRVQAQWFVARGYAVMAPSRRGRGGSEGRYDEGFGLDRSRGYTCEEPLSVAGADRALRDIDAVTAVLLAQPFVDRSRVVIAGQSRGGIMSVAWSGRQPTVPKAVVNFVGGWIGAGCENANSINRGLLNRGIAWGQPSLWLYGDKDPFYPLSHTRANFAAFHAAGGKGTFQEYPPPEGSNGHGIGSHPALWTAVTEAYLAERRLPSKPAN